MAASFNKIFGKESQPKSQDIDVLWQLIEQNYGRRVLPKLLSYINERQVHPARWIKAIQQTSVPMYFVNGVQDPISEQHMLDHYNQIIPNPRSTALYVGHYPQLEAPKLVLNLYRQFLNDLVL